MYELVNSYFPRIYKRIWDLIDSTDDIGDCIINYVTTTQSIEVVDSSLKINSTIRNLDFINCEIKNGIFEKCMFYGCEINNVQISKSKIDNSEIGKSKILNSRVESSTLENCFFMNGFFNGSMIGGVWRSGDLGPFASISPETKIVDDNQNFFDTKFDSDVDKETKGIIKQFKK
jgi:bifunctional N-acetylglucosamine-1-phosphate-uridyltransferase/glucosamine-1-phosphate-acetyltransferase GlmU-like protein